MRLQEEHQQRPQLGPLQYGAFWVKRAAKIARNAANEIFTQSWPYPFAQVDNDDNLYRRLTGKREQDKDLTPFAQEKMGKIAYYLVDVNPLAKALISLMVGFTIGRGLNFSSDDEKIRNVLKDFWSDPVNKMQLRQFDLVRSLFIFGELALPVAVNPNNGFIRVGYIDPTHITKVHLNEFNALIKDRVYYKVVTLDSGVMEEKGFDVINIDLEQTTLTRGTLTGEGFFFTINGVPNSGRGRSELLPAFDWLDGYDKFLYSRLQRAIMQNNLVWDVALEDANPEEVAKWIEERRKRGSAGPPKPGGMLVHNNKEIWTPIVPDFKSSDNTADASLFQSMIAVSLLFPRHFLSLPGDTSRAVGVEMQEPTVKHIESKQLQIEDLFSTQFHYAIDQAALRGLVSTKWIKRRENRFNMSLPEISPKSLDKVSRGMERAMKAMDVCIENGTVTKGTATKILHVFAQNLGVSFDIDKEIIGAAKEVKDRDTANKIEKEIENGQKGDTGNGNKIRNISRKTA
jgi:hypothetical protein